MSRTRGWASATLFSALALGCAKPAHVPAEYVGDVPLTIVNDATGPVCDLIMIDPTRVNKENWIGSRGLEPGKSLEFRVRPAIYIAKVRGCQHWLNTPDTELYTGGAPRIEINGPTVMSIGGTPKPPPGVAAASVPVQYPAPVTAGPSDCTPEGQDPAVYGNKPCCTHAIHPHPNHSGNGQMECCEINNSSGDCHRQ